MFLPKMDLNWFFSTFSQSAAALLGVIAAFIIARLQSLDERIGTLKYDFDGLVVEKIRIERKLKSINISQTIKYLITSNPDFFTKKSNGEFDTLSQEEQLTIINDAITPLTDEKTILLKEFKTMMQLETFQQYRNNTYDIGISNRSKIGEIVGEIDILKLQFTRIFNTYEVMLKHLINIQYIIYILIISFPILVVYPLHFLPLVNINISFNLNFIFNSLFSFKGVLLILFFIAFEFIFIYFLRLSKRTIANNVWGTERNKYLFYKEYSQYLAN